MSPSCTTSAPGGDSGGALARRLRSRRDSDRQVSRLEWRDGFLEHHLQGDVEVSRLADGYETARLEERDGGFTVWYEADGAVVGVLTLNADDDYDRGEELMRSYSR